MFGVTTLALLLAAVSARTVTEDKSLGSNTWKTGAWGTCFAEGGCGEGRRERQVWCSEGDGRTALQFQCDVIPEPPRLKSCFKACRHHRDKLQWQVSSWGPCLNVTPVDSPVNQSLGPRLDHGVMQRNVTCVLLSQDAVKMVRQVDEENCLRVSRKPDPLRTCHVPKLQDCVVGPFSDWSTCEGCQPENRTRVRVVLVAPRHAGKPCPELTETQACPPQDDCANSLVVKPKLPGFKLKLGAWRRCELPDSNSLIGNGLDNGGTSSVSSAESAESLLGHQPEVGYQMREVTCGDSHGTSVDTSNCLMDERGAVEMPATIQPCIVARDCAVSQWSAWARTQDGCQMDTEVRAEIHERRRDVLRLAEGAGRACPHLVETRQITEREHMPHCALKYRWLAGKWSSGCAVTSESSGVENVGCGGGVQLRAVTCVESASSQPVSDELCDTLEALPTVQRCEVACSRDCELGGWQPWGPCKPMRCPMGRADVEQSGYRTRLRHVKVAASEGGVACPHLDEVQACPQPRCHSWLLGDWGACQLAPGNKQCGEGIRRRSLACVSIDGAVVDDSLCQYDQPLREESCWLPCPYDCVVSPWSGWSHCSHACSSPHQVALQQRNRTVVATQGAGGHPCPDPDQMLQLQPCNMHSCVSHSWLPLPWQPCQPTNRSADEGEEGAQRREVWCLENNDHRVSDHNCGLLPEPILERSCSIPARVDCQMSPWSAWSSCPNECVPDASSEVRDGEVAPIQTRHRVVAQFPSADGEPCPPAEELRPCPLSAARCNHFMWSHGEWSDCQMPSSNRCGSGFRTRSVWCYRNQRSARVSPGLCPADKQPDSWQACHVDCQLQCVLSDWSSWSRCSQACQHRMRFRELISMWNEDCGRLVLKQSSPCPCERYSAVALSDWSECVIDSDVTSVSANGRPAAGVCGAGSRYRAQACHNDKKEVVESSLCGFESGLSQEPCLVPCPVDCRVSEWSAWGDCSAICGPGMHNRSREVLVGPQSGGRPCGELQQTKSCRESCRLFEWEAQGWSECRLIAADTDRGCGTGDQYRTVRCVRDGEQVSDSHCDLTTQPADINACHVACPGDCVLGPWSDWSTCAQPCESGHERQRTRSVLRHPALSSARQPTCPPLIQAQPCQVNVTCFTYAWHATDWSACLPLGGSPCGEGVNGRAVYCRRSDGMPAADSECLPESRPALSEKWCYVDCPVDCELSHWSAWNESACACGASGMVAARARHVLTAPSPLGRPCAAPLQQTRPCPVRNCYNLIAGPWGDCQLQGAWCGHGTVARNVSCVVVGSERSADMELCAGRLPTSEHCYVPCSEDCHVTQWSRWSHCHRDCHAIEQGGGYQTRSRAVVRAATAQGEACPAALWETRPCFTGPCLTFNWATTADGRVECQRSDGEFVVGGCDSKPKPCDGTSCSCVGGTDCVEKRLSTVGSTAMVDDEIQSLLYYPREEEVNVWVLAIIAIGAVFVVFVAVSGIVLCRLDRNGGSSDSTSPAKA